MVDVPIRHRRAPAQHAAPEPRLWQRPLVLIGGAVAAVILAAVLLQVAIRIYEGQSLQAGLTTSTRPVELAIAAETLTIPANMIRTGKVRRGGAVERAELVIHWPEITGYSEALAEDFREGAVAAPVIYAAIAARDAPVDSTGRLDSVYARFFIGKALPAPDGLVGRALAPESGYGGEVIFFAPDEPRPFVARCFAEETPEMPATCLRDIHFGTSLAMIYRFNRNLLADWRALDREMRRLAAGFLAPPQAE